jgi:hypothetical protein
MISKYSHIDRPVNAEILKKQEELMQKMNDEVDAFNKANNSRKPSPMSEVHRNHEESEWTDHYEDFDYGYHDQFEM